MAEVAIGNMAPSTVERSLVFTIVAGIFSATAAVELCVGRPPAWSADGCDMDTPYGLLNNVAIRKFGQEKSGEPSVVRMTGWNGSNESTAERIAKVLRQQITEGDVPPGTQLGEERLVARLGVSRNTLREAFRLLTYDGLLVHRHNRGVFVPVLDEGDLVDLYRLRRIVECGVLRSLTGLDPNLLLPLRAEVEAAESAASRGEWDEVVTANMRFHQCLARLTESRRIQDITRRVLAELRLVFHVVSNPEVLHEGYVRRNRALLDLLEAGEIAQAADELEQYLRDSEEELLEAYRTMRRVGSAEYARTSVAGEMR